MKVRIAAFGRLGRDPDVRETRKGQPMAIASVAINVPHREDGEAGDDHTLWANCFAFGRTSDALGACVKGDAVSIAGELTHSSYVGRDGEKREGWSIMCDSVIAAPRRQEAARRHAAQPDDDDFGEDIPF